MPIRPWVELDRAFWLHAPRTDEDWDRLAADYVGERRDSPLHQVFRVARAGGCKTVVIENRYVDLDYRSEYAAFWSSKFDGQSPFARRFHFFTSELSEGGLHRLPEDAGYLGYSVIRPVEYGRVGRTVLKPPPDLHNATLTTIVDEVSLFGNVLEVRGVPFCEQDSEFLRCAHAAAWICHYIAYRRGLVGRRSTGEIVDLSPSMLSPERALPSKGMTLNQLQAVFGGLDQPALFYGLRNMPIVPGVPDPDPPDPDTNGQTDPPGFWDKRMISIICRYLNSGFPVLIGAQDHAFILVGWRREGDGQVSFIACDDQIGPYEVIGDPFTHYKAPWDSIMIPLPPKVYLSGESAEGNAHGVFRSIAGQADHLKFLEKGLLDHTVVLRTMLRTGAELKLEIETRTKSDEVLQLVRYARLPRWVWIIEAHDKPTCEVGEPCVLAAAIYDATSFDRQPPVDILSMPGLVAVYPPDGAPLETSNGSTEPWSSLLGHH
jgi:hypothetical protein